MSRAPESATRSLRALRHAARAATPASRRRSQQSKAWRRPRLTLVNPLPARDAASGRARSNAWHFQDNESVFKVYAARAAPTAREWLHAGRPAAYALRRHPLRPQAIVMGRKGRPSSPAGMQAPGPQQGAAARIDPRRARRAVFYLYCRTGPGKPWYPVSAMKGDGQSKGLIGAWLNSPFGKSGVQGPPR